MSTRSRFENLQKLLDAIDSANAYGDLPPSILNSANNVREEFQDELNGYAILVTWSIGDVQSRYMDNHDTEADDYQDLTDEEARDILVRMERNHDADIGINWTVIDVYLDEK